MNYNPLFEKFYYANTILSKLDLYLTSHNNYLSPFLKLVNISILFLNFYQKELKI